jgi:predicted transcriptional regulator
MPYTEKISVLSSGRYSVSNFVRLYQNKLRYFGDLRNQLVHGFRLDNNHYVLASDHAVKEIELLYTEARTPTSAGDAFSKQVYTCTTQDLLSEVIHVMRNQLNTHVPVYNEQGIFTEMLSESTISYRLADEIGDDGEVHLAQIRVQDVTLENSNDLFIFVPLTTSIYDIEQLFAQNLQAKKRLGAVFLTHTGKPEEDIQGIITAMDLPRLSDHFVL